LKGEPFLVEHSDWVIKDCVVHECIVEQSFERERAAVQHHNAIASWAVVWMFWASGFVAGALIF
jgi:hypothetical protein